MELTIKECLVRELDGKRDKKRYIIMIKTPRGLNVRLERKNPTIYAALNKYAHMGIIEIDRLLDKYNFDDCGKKIPTQKLKQEIESIAVMRNLAAVK